jgi:hypothetical protein
MNKQSRIKDLPQILSAIFMTTALIAICTALIAICVAEVVLGSSRERFQQSCQSFGGEFYQLENTSCQLGHEKCIFNCRLNGNIYNLDTLGDWIFYRKYFCVEDCKYENSKSNETRCVC